MNGKIAVPAFLRKWRSSAGSRLKAPAWFARERPVRTGRLPTVSGAKVRRFFAECGWYRGSLAFVPCGTGAFFFCRPSGGLSYETTILRPALRGGLLSFPHRLSNGAGPGADPGPDAGTDNAVSHADAHPEAVTCSGANVHTVTDANAYADPDSAVGAAGGAEP